MADTRRAPRVAVIIPAHNAETFLGEALESVLRQIYRDWEVVVADDASSDGTRAVAEAFAAREPDRIRVVSLERNAGPAPARNAAVAASSGGELLALLDADDWWREDYLEHLVGLFDEGQARGRRVGIVSCNPLIETEEGLTGETFAQRFWWSDSIDYDGMIERSYVHVSSLFPRAAYDEVGGFSPECWGTEDYDLWLRIMEAGYEVINTRANVAVYRVHASALSRNSVVVADAGITAYRRALERGALLPRQRQALKARVRHYRALRERALFLNAVGERRPAGILLHGSRGAWRGLLAFAQSPSRWAEWAGDILRIARRRSLGPD